MPIVTLPIEENGLFLRCTLQPSQPRLLAMHSKGIAAPTPVTFRALLDSGSSTTCIESSIIKGLQIPRSGTTQVHSLTTAGKSVSCSLFDVSLVLHVGNHVHTISALPVVECSLAAQGIHAIIGRDVLSQLYLVINGPMKFFTLCV